MIKSKARIVLDVSDLHIGSTTGLWPEGFVSNEGFLVGQNKYQKWLWKCWQDMLVWKDKVINGDDYEIVICGDALEGQHHRTMQIMTADIGDQITAAISVLTDLVSKASRVHVIKGTECHTAGHEIHMGKSIGASVDPATGQHAWDTLDLEINGTLYNFAHHVATSCKSAHEAGEFSRNLTDITHCRARTGKRVPKVVVRAHRHRHGVWNDGNQIHVITGPWQGLTRHGYKVVPNAITQPSAVIFDSRLTEKGDLPLVHQRVYTPQ